MKKEGYRIGIDVGGTFTKAVAIDSETLQVAAKVTVPTTHAAHEGVSRGVIEALRALLEKMKLDPKGVELMAHSTTQAVNSLLEGDVSRVGILAMASSYDRKSAIKRTSVGDITLAPGKALKTDHRFLDTGEPPGEETIDRTLLDMVKEGAEAIVASEAFSVDNPKNEHLVMGRASLLGIPCTAGHEVTSTYGLEIRTTTACINASILPKMMSISKMVEKSIRLEGIDAPIMIMKGDGGVTDLKTFRAKPILTILSGPAASMAGALLYLRVTKGIFIEVGGTSTNIGLIKDGKPVMNYVKIMDHPTCIRSMDVRVVGAAGGSMARLQGRKVPEVGPRSAHIAGLPYSCFAEPSELTNARLVLIQPKSGDPPDYVAVKGRNGKLYAITNTCAANALGLVPEGDYAHGDRESARLAIGALAEQLNCSIDEAAKRILDVSCKVLREMLDGLMKEHRLKGEELSIVGGGGGASTLIPYLASMMGMAYRVCENAEVISSIGVAMTMVREEIERTVVKADAEELSRLIDEIYVNMIEKGALPSSISISTELIPERSIVRVIALGSVSTDATLSKRGEAGVDEARRIAGEALNLPEGKIELIEETGHHYIFRSEVEERHLLIKRSRSPLIIVDKFGRVQLSVENGVLLRGSGGEVMKQIREYIRSRKAGMKGAVFVPELYVVSGFELLDLSFLTTPQQVETLLEKKLEPSQRALAIIRRS